MLKYIPFLEDFTSSDFLPFVVKIVLFVLSIYLFYEIICILITNINKK